MEFHFTETFHSYPVALISSAVGLFDELSEGLNAAQRALGALGPRPSGDPEGLRAMARAVRQEADTAASIGRLERSIPETIVFEGPAARRFDANAGEVAESLFVSQRMLDSAADAIEHAASRIAKAQADYDRTHNGLLGQVADLGRRLTHIVP
jgi:uncharacterized protein YukE